VAGRHLGRFALLPVFSAVALGRFIDRGNDSQAPGSAPHWS